MRHEDLALRLRQLVDRQLERIEQHAARVQRLRSGIGRRQQVFQPQPLIFESQPLLLLPAPGFLGFLLRAHSLLPVGSLEKLELGGRHLGCLVSLIFAKEFE